MYSIDQSQLIYPLAALTEQEVLFRATNFAQRAFAGALVDVSLLKKESEIKGHSLYRVIIYTII